jgi:hypothetical protein
MGVFIKNLLGKSIDECFEVEKSLTQVRGGKKKSEE